MPEHSRKPLSSSFCQSTVYYALLTSQLNFCFYIRSHDGKKHCNRAFKTKRIEQYFSLVLFIMLYTVVRRLRPCMESWKVAIQMRGTEQYFFVFLFFINCDARKFILSVWVKSKVWPLKWMLLSSTQFPVALSRSTSNLKVWTSKLKLIRITICTMVQFIMLLTRLF